MKWRKGKKDGEIFHHHNDLGPLVADDARTWIRALRLNAKVAFSAEGWDKLFELWIMSRLKELNPKLAQQGVLKGGLFTTPEGWRFVILGGYPYRLDVPVDVKSKIMDRWKSGMPEEAEFQPMAIYPRVPGHEGYCSPSDLFQFWDKVVEDPGMSVVPVCGASAVWKDEKNFRRYSKKKIDGDWVLESEGEIKPNTHVSSSIDAGMPGNEEGAWGSSSGDGWRVD